MDEKIYPGDQSDAVFAASGKNGESKATWDGGGKIYPLESAIDF